jgi:sensor histidine kinase YesM
VEISAHRAGGGAPGAAPDRLELRVRDDGVGAPGGVTREGIGLGNARARLRSLYGTAHRFEAGSPPGGGFVVSITIPLRARARDGRDGREGAP